MRTTESDRTYEVVGSVAMRLAKDDRKRLACKPAASHRITAEHKPWNLCLRQGKGKGSGARNAVQVLNEPGM